MSSSNVLLYTVWHINCIERFEKLPIRAHDPNYSRHHFCTQMLMNPKPYGLFRYWFKLIKITPNLSVTVLALFYFSINIAAFIDVVLS